jgi:hypothetical protein
MSLRDRLLSRPLPTAEYRLRVDDPSEAQGAVAAAKQLVQLATLRDDTDQLVLAQEAMSKAQTMFDACFVVVTVRALPPGEFEALAKLHPAREGTDDQAWNAETFPKACFLACAEGDLTEQEWEQVLAQNVSEAERAALYTLACAINVRVPDPSVPKDWTSILSSN